MLRLNQTKVHHRNAGSFHLTWLSVLRCFHLFVVSGALNRSKIQAEAHGGESFLRSWLSGRCLRFSVILGFDNIAIILYKISEA